MPLLVSFLDGEHSSAANVDRFPIGCPCCDERVPPRFVGAAVRTKSSREICFQCTNEDCRALFIATYIEERTAAYRFVESEPNRRIGAACCPEVQQISPGFFKVYEEAIAAEAIGLKELSQLGLRTAFQRLVTDFCKYENPASRSQIDQMPFEDCVARYVVNTALGNCLCGTVPPGEQAAAWTQHLLASSEEGLKDLVRLTANFVESVVLANRLRPKIRARATTH